jgi:S-adenosylmethionine:tRNA ribosyltransferase-isomerase
MCALYHCVLVHISELDYDLPPELIAQHPAEPRDSSRLLACDRATQAHQHKRFHDLPAFLRPNDLLVANDTSVINARLHGRKPTGGKVEVLLLRKLDDVTWTALVGGRNVRHVEFLSPSPLGGEAERPGADRHSGRSALWGRGEGVGVSAEVTENPADATFTVRFSEPIEPHLDRLGETPLPPYIHARSSAPERYQTVYARVAGSAAAPTAGLHFTPRLLDQVRDMGVRVAFVTLHVGLDTFKPIDEDEVEAHKIHSEWCELPQATADAINETRQRGGRVIAVGTTSARVLETWGVKRELWADGSRQHSPHASLPTAYSGFTSIYITPGYTWQVVDAMITNFHLPRSTLLAMIGSFMGMDYMRRTYALAIAERYRFYSFGDAMLVV